MKLYIFLTITLFFFTSCFTKTVTKDSSSSSSSSTGSSDSGDTNDNGSGDTDDTYGKVPPFSFGPIISHGGSNSTVVWSSKTSVTPLISDQSVFMTDVVLKFKVKAMASPGKGTDSLGRACLYDPMNYSKIKLNVGVRSSTSSSYTDYAVFEVNVGSTSAAQTLTPPVTSEPFIVEVYGPQWDWNCKYYTGTIYQNTFCPWYPVHTTDCIQYELEMVTDNTLSF